MKWFNKLVSIALLSIFSFSVLCSQTIIIQQSVFPGKPVKFASHYGDNIFLEREVNTDENGKCVFFNDSLKSGIYYIIFSDSSSYSFLYDSDFSGKITLSYNEGTNNLNILTAPAPTLKYEEYTSLVNYITTELDEVRSNLKQVDLKNKERKSLLKQREDLHLKKDSVILAINDEFKESLLGIYSKALIKITVPEYVPEQSIVNKDSAIWKWRTDYYNKHYLDNIDLADHRLIKTPVYTSMVNTYLDKITLQKPENLTYSIDLILTKVKDSSISKEFLTDYLLKKYNRLKNSPTYEVAYLHIIENYYLKENAFWLNDSDMQALSDEFNRRKPLEIGQIAPLISSSGLNKRELTLEMFNSEIIILYFFNYDCEHCKRTTSEINKIILRYDTSYVQVFGVCLGESELKCEKYIKENSFNNWVCGIGSNNTQSIASDYNLEYTPTIYLLDRDKKIISKNVLTSHLDRLLKK